MGILDQAVFSGANFIASVLLARWLSGAEFGAFAIGYVVLTFFFQIYSSFVLEPIGVLGPSHYSERLPAYLLTQVKLLFGLFVPIGMILTCFVWMYQSVNRADQTAQILVVIGLSLPFLLLPLLLRRAFYVLAKPGMALLGSLIYSTLLIIILYYASRAGILNGAFGILAISISGLASGLILFFSLRGRWSATFDITIREVLTQNWSFGKWLIISGIFIALATQIQVYLAGAILRLEEAGAVRVLQTFIQPMMLTSTAMSALATPVITSEFVDGQFHVMHRKVILFTVVLAGMSIIYEIFLFVFAKPLELLLFDGRFSDYADQIAVWGLVPLFLSLFWGGVIGLQAAQKSYAMLIIALPWAFFSLITGLIYIPLWGVWGATFSNLIGYLAAGVSCWILYWLWVYRKSVGSVRP